MMKPEEFSYAVETEKSFDDAVIAVLKAAEQRGWALFQIYDIKERMAAKGFEHHPLKIIELCAAKHANQLLKQNRLVSLCMPCKINVFQENTAVRIVTMKPTMMTQFFPEINPEDAKIIEKDVIAIVDGAR